jgi:acyl dehydratase
VKGLREGQELEPFVVDPVDPARMKTMALLLDDPNPLHWDAEALRRGGFDERPFNQGPTNMSYLMEMAIRVGGGRTALRRFSVRFLGNVLAGQRLECTGTVKSVDAEAGTAELELMASADGEPVLTGTATVTLP